MKSTAISTAISTSLFDSVKKKQSTRSVCRWFSDIYIYIIAWYYHDIAWQYIMKKVEKVRSTGLGFGLASPLKTVCLKGIELELQLQRGSMGVHALCTPGHREPIGEPCRWTQNELPGSGGTRWHACGTRSPATDGYSATGGNCNCATVNMAKQSAKHVGKIENVEKIWQKMAKDGKNGKRSRNQNLAWDREFQRQNSCQSKSNCSLMLAFVKKRSKKQCRLISI